jgi:hypothetical protein
MPNVTSISLQDRLEHGFLTIDEYRSLNGNQSKSSFYKDLKAGKISIKKLGRKSIIPGPVAKRGLTEFAP